MFCKNTENIFIHIKFIYSHRRWMIDEITCKCKFVKTFCKFILFYIIAIAVSGEYLCLCTIIEKICMWLINCFFFLQTNLTFSILLPGEQNSIEMF